MAKAWGGGGEMEGSFYTFYNSSRAFKHCFSLFLHQTIHFEAILAGISKIAPLRSSDIKRSKPKQKNINKSWLYLHILQWLQAVAAPLLTPEKHCPRQVCALSHSLKNSSIRNLSLIANDKQHHPQFQLLPILSPTLNFPFTFRLQKQAFDRPSPLRQNSKCIARKAETKAMCSACPPSSPTWSQINADFA